LVKKKLN